MEACIHLQRAFQPIYIIYFHKSLFRIMILDIAWIWTGLYRGVGWSLWVIGNLNIGTSKLGTEQKWPSIFVSLLFDSQLNQPTAESLQTRWQGRRSGLTSHHGGCTLRRSSTEQWSRVQLTWGNWSSPPWWRGAILTWGAWWGWPETGAFFSYTGCSWFMIELMMDWVWKCYLTTNMLLI